MDFRLPFPTLKHLTMVCIGKVTLDKEIRPFKKLWELNDDKKPIYEMDVDNIVTPLSLSSTLKHDLADVISGIFHHIKENLFIDRYRSIKNLENIELLFNGRGKLDISSIWRRHFDREVRNYKDVDLLLDLLQSTIKQGMWYGIDAILSKILTQHVRNPNVKLMRGKGDVIRQAMVYNFRNSQTKPASKVISRLNRLFQHRENISVSKVGVFIPVNVYRLDYEFLEDHYKTSQRSMGPKEKLVFFSKAMFDLFDRGLNMECVVHVLKTLDEKIQRQCFVVISVLQPKDALTNEYRLNFFHSLMCRFLDWPHTQWFMSFLKVIGQYLTTHEYFIVVGELEKRIPKRERFGVHYANLLARYWEAIPENVKQDFIDNGSCMSGCDHVAVLEEDMISLQDKNLFLFAKISTEIWPDDI